MQIRFQPNDKCTTIITLLRKVARCAANIIRSALGCCQCLAEDSCGTKGNLSRRSIYAVTLWPVSSSILDTIIEVISEGFMFERSGCSKRVYLIISHAGNSARCMSTGVEPIRRRSMRSNARCSCVWWIIANIFADSSSFEKPIVSFFNAIAFTLPACITKCHRR